MRIGILTFHRAYNCGAMLQAWALKTILERMGHQVEFPNCNKVGETPRWHRCDFGGKALYQNVRNFISVTLVNFFSIGIEDKKRWLFKKFRSKHLPECKCSPAAFEMQYDRLMVGSDQVWNPDCAGECDTPLFLLENFSFSKPIIAYAVSCGDDLLAQETSMRIQAAAGRCAAVSVREPLVNAILKCQYPIVPDPTLLLTRADYRQFVKVRKPRKRKYMYCFTLGASDFVVSKAKALAKRLDVELIIQPTYQFSRWRAPKGLSYDLSPNGMVDQMFNADYILASSFHGTVFAILSGKPFLSLRDRVDTSESRPASLLRQLDMGERLVNPMTTLDEMERLINQPFPSDLHGRLEEMRKNGIYFLLNTLKDVLVK